MPTMLALTVSTSQVVVWLIVGAIAGTLLGRVLKGERTGFGWWQNLGIGLVGALIGGGIFSVFDIDLGLGDIAVSLQDLIAALLGSLAFLLVLWIARKRKAKAGPPAA